MTPPEASGRAASQPARGNATHDAQGPNKPASEHARAGLRFLTGIPGLPIRPHRTKAQRDALHALAESNPTPTEYERRKAEILRGDTTT